MTWSGTSVIDQSLTAPALDQLLDRLVGEPVERRAGVGRQEHPVGVAALEQRERRRVALAPSAGTSRSRSGRGRCRRPSRAGPRCSRGRRCRRCARSGSWPGRRPPRGRSRPAAGRCSTAGREWAMIGAPGAQARARARAVDLLDVLGDARLVGRALEEAGLDRRCPGCPPRCRGRRRRPSRRRRGSARRAAGSRRCRCRCRRRSAGRVSRGHPLDEARRRGRRTSRSARRSS